MENGCCMGLVQKHPSVRLPLTAAGEIQAESGRRKAEKEKSRTPAHSGFLVRVTGFEPTASWSRTKRATSCATPGFKCYIIITAHAPFVKGNGEGRGKMLTNAPADTIMMPNGNDGQEYPAADAKRGRGRCKRP